MASLQQTARGRLVLFTEGGVGLQPDGLQSGADPDQGAVGAGGQQQEGLEPCRIASSNAWLVAVASSNEHVLARGVGEATPSGTRGLRVA